MLRPTASIGLVLVAIACADGGSVNDPAIDFGCTIPTDQIFEGTTGGRDAIPALTNPPLVAAGHASAAYLGDDDLVLGILWSDQPIAIPHNIGWWHEVVNIDLEGLRAAVTFCPLTGSGLAFDRTPADGATFGVSGLLYQNNLIMYDRNDPESLWPQMARGARCGTRTGAALSMLPLVEMTWQAWRSLHPGTLVVSGSLGLGRDYTFYPYGSYDRLGNNQLLYPIESIDRRRELKERVLGIPAANGAGGVAFPFGELARVGRVAAVREVVDGEEVVVLWDQEARAAMAYRPVTAGMPLTFEVQSGRLLDRETGSEWAVDGSAIDGPLAGTRMEPIAEAYVSFWFAWAAFHRQTRMWTEG